LNLRKKVSQRSLVGCAYRKKSVVEQGSFHEFAFDNKALLKDSWNFESVENVRSSKVVEFEIRTLSNSNFVTSLVVTAQRAAVFSLP